MFKFLANIPVYYLAALDGPTGPRESVPLQKSQTPPTVQKPPEAPVGVTSEAVPKVLDYNLLQDKLAIGKAASVLTKADKEFLSKLEKEATSNPKYSPSVQDLVKLASIIKKVENHLKGEVEGVTRKSFHFTVFGHEFGNKSFNQLVQTQSDLKQQLAEARQGGSPAKISHLEAQLHRVNDRLSEKLQRVGTVVKYREYTSTQEKRAALSEALIDHLRRGTPEQRLQAIQDPKTPLKVLEAMGQEFGNDPKVRDALLANKDTPLRGLQGIMQHCGNDMESKCKIAMHPKVDADLLTRLSQDDSVQVQRLVAKQRNTPSEVLTRLAGSQDVEVRQAVAGNLRTTTETLTNLARDGDAGVRQAVAGHINTNTDVVEALARDPNPLVSQAAVANIGDYPLQIDKGTAKLAELTSRFQQLTMPRTAEQLPELLKIAQELAATRKQLEPAFTAMKELRAGDLTLHNKATELEKDALKKLGDLQSQVAPVLVESGNLQLAKSVQEYRALPTTIQNPADDQEIQQLSGQTGHMINEAEKTRNSVTEALKGLGHPQEQVDQFKENYNNELVRPLRGRQNTVEGIGYGISTNITDYAKAIMQAQGTPEDAEALVAQVVSKIPRTNIEQIQRDVQIATMVMQRLDLSGVPPQVRDKLLREDLANLFTAGAQAPDTQEFFNKTLPQAIDQKLTAGMNPTEQMQYYAKTVFGKDTDNIKDPLARKLLSEVANPSALRAEQIGPRLELLKNVQASIDARLKDPVEVLHTERLKLPALDLLSATIDLSQAKFRGDLGDGAKGVERTFWIELPDGTKAIGKKSNPPYMTAHERMGHVLGAWLDLPVNKVQMGTFNLDGKPTLVSVHHLVGDKAQAFYKVANELGIPQERLDYRNQFGLDMFDRGLGDYDSYYTCQGGPSTLNMDNADKYFEKLKERVVNPEIFDRIVLFDKLTDNQDRHPGNYMVTPAGKNQRGETMYEVHLIDHGRTLSFGQPIDVQQRVNDFGDYLNSLTEPKNKRHLQSIAGDLRRIASLTDDQLERQLFDGIGNTVMSDRRKVAEIAILKGKRDLLNTWLQTHGADLPQ